jgi:hypothetical protein
MERVGGLCSLERLSSQRRLNDRNGSRAAGPLRVFSGPRHSGSPTPERETPEGVSRLTPF